MAIPLTPGVYFQPSLQRRPVTTLLRSDVAALLGYARRGPTALPVQIHSWRQFLAVFGQPYSVGYLADAVKGFFENGGATCFVSRLTDETAEAAELILSPDVAEGQPALGYEWKFSASFLLSSIAGQLQSDDTPDATARLASEQDLNQTVKRIPNPGQWGNQLSLSVSRDPLVNTWTVAGVMEQGYVTAVHGISGLAANSIVELYQENEDGSDEVTGVALVERVDSLRQQVYWVQSLRDLGFDLNRPVRLESVEFSFQVALDNRVVENFSSLSIRPDHDHSVERIIGESSQYLDVEVVAPGSEVDEDHYTDSRYWLPSVFNQLFSGGTDGLTGVTVDVYLDALKALEKIDEIGLLATPDLVLRPEPPMPVQAISAVAAPECKKLEEPLKGSLYGRVLSFLEGDESVEDGADGQPIKGVTITYTAGGKQTRTDANGDFQLDNIDVGLITLRFEKVGYEVEEQLILSQLVAPADPVRFYIKPLLLPPALSNDDVLLVQQAMAAQGETGLYRFALLDPPEPDMNIDEIRGWRQKLGDTAHAALFYPWVGIANEAKSVSGINIKEGPIKWVPPSGHIAGLAAKTDLAEGVHRAPANFSLRHVKHVAINVNEVQQGLLNPEGINCIRGFPGRGLRPFGARTLSSNAEWRYLNVRRLVSALEKTLEKTMQWAVFESNNTLLRQAVSYGISTLLNRLWRQGALAGDSAKAAYLVKCDEDNNPPRVRDGGQLVVDVAVAPSVPYEFIIFRLGKTMEAIEVTE